jgi:hypothetical protein
MRRARPIGPKTPRANTLRRIALVAASTVAAFVLGAVGAEWLFTPAPPPVSAPSAAIESDEAEAAMRQNVERLYSLMMEMVPRRVENAYVDYISPAEMLRDLNDRHGAECDRPDLDRRMIEQLSPRR